MLSSTFTQVTVFMPVLPVTRASQGRYSQPNIATDTPAPYASLPNVALVADLEHSLPALPPLGR